MAELTDGAAIRDTVRQKYAAAARAAAMQVDTPAACCGSEIQLTDADGQSVFGGALYTSDEAMDAPASAVNALLGCGAPTRARKPPSEGKDAGCCSPAELGTCCEPEAKTDCCGATAAETSTAPNTCGCQTP